MSEIHLLHESKAWYDFVSQQAVNDPQVRDHIANYMDAQTKLNERLIELVEAHPDLNLTIKRASNGDALTGGLIGQIKAYHDRHGVDVSEASLCEEACNAGYEIIDVEE